MQKRNSKKTKNKKLELPAERILEALAGVLAMGLPYNKKGVCTSCRVKEARGTIPIAFTVTLSC